MLHALGDVPMRPKLYLQFDNASDNKCFAVMGLAAWLVQTNRVQQVELRVEEEWARGEAWLRHFGDRAEWHAHGLGAESHAVRRLSGARVAADACHDDVYCFRSLIRRDDPIAPPSTCTPASGNNFVTCSPAAHLSR